MSNLLTMSDVLVGPTPRGVVGHADQPLSARALRSHGSNAACMVGARTVSHAELADLIDQRRAELGTTPIVVVLFGPNSLDFVVTYLAALDGGHPVIVASDAVSAERFAERFGAHACVDGATGVVRASAVSPDHRVAGWHGELAALMSTSGSTGSPKLVRLSMSAISSNAVAIAEALGLTSNDRAITSLPVHYCYGLSVITSHLAVGASVVLTDLSVVDPCFWAAVEQHDVTTLAGVPHTFEMIERRGTDALAASSLRVITQAGGRMDPGRVEAFASLGVELGWDFVVMYGQTEATARMTVLRPAGALIAPTAVGTPIPGGSVRLDPVEGQLDGVGEVVYKGPNVMMGYASGADDLAQGFDLEELRTGDLGRFGELGNLEIIGRCNRFLKLHGKRVDLDHLAEQLRAELGDGCDARLVGDDDGMVVALLDPETDHSGREAVFDSNLRDHVARLVDLPRGLVIAVRVAAWPRTASGKSDGPAIVSVARSSIPLDGPDATDVTVTDAYATVFGAAPEPTESFASLGGDSFSYVEMSIRLEAVLGELPTDWHLQSVEQLEVRRRERASSTEGAWRRHTSAVDTSVVVRAIGILLIVCTHMGIYRLAGGAHALLAVVGFNVARFQLLPTDVPGRLKRAASTIGRIAVPASAWIGFNMLVAGGYSLGAVFLVNNYTGSGHRTDGRWEYWYFEAFVQIMVVLALVFSIRPIRHAEQTRPFAFAVGVLGLTWLFRFEIVNLGGAYNEIFRPHTVVCFLAVGWCAQRAATTWQRVLVSVLAIVTTLGYFETVGRTGQLDRELRILAMVLALVWISSIRLPKIAAAIVGRIAAASMWIFLVHWQVWPLFTPWFDDRFAYVLTILSGIVVWWATGRLEAAWLKRRHAQDRVAVRSTSSQVSAADTAINTSDATPVSA